jgi:hypothetical protein
MGAKFIPTATVSSFGGNELSLLRIHDAIRNNKVQSYSFANIFSIDFTTNHSFKLLNTVYIDNQPLYHISFQSFYFISRGTHVARGEIFIEHGSYAIRKLVYAMFMKEGGKEKLLYSINEEYARTDSTLCLNYISFNNFFKSRTDMVFRVADVLFDRPSNSFVVTFNRSPQRATALNERNYNFRFNNVPLKIKEIKISDHNDRQVRVMVSNVTGFKAAELAEALSRRFETSFKNIKDMDGNEVNEVVYKPVNQFRELFLQKLSSQLPETGLFISKQLPLVNSPIDSLRSKNTFYWMNTPLMYKMSEGAEK